MPHFDRTMAEARTQICITIRFNLNSIFLNYSHIVLAIITAGQPEVKQPKLTILINAYATIWG